MAVDTKSCEELLICPYCTVFFLRLLMLSNSREYSGGCVAAVLFHTAQEASRTTPSIHTFQPVTSLGSVWGIIVPLTTPRKVVDTFDDVPLKIRGRYLVKASCEQEASGYSMSEAKHWKP
jgi:hypothetical protein